MMGRHVSNKADNLPMLESDVTDGCQFDGNSWLDLLYRSQDCSLGCSFCEQLTFIQKLLAVLYVRGYEQFIATKLFRRGKSGFASL